MVFKSIKFLLITISAVLTLHVHASIIDNGDFTTDIGSGLDWLDVTQTQAQSYDTVTARISAGGDLYGWRFASGDEVVTLLYNWGLLIGPPSATSNGAPKWQETEIDDQLTHIVIKTLGDTKQAAFNEFNPPIATSDLEGQAIFTAGWISDGTQIGTPNEQHYDFMINDSDFTWSDGTVVADPDFVEKYSTQFPTDFGIPDIGAFLVRPTVIPVPAAVWLFGSGLLGLIGVARRKKS